MQNNIPTVTISEIHRYLGKVHLLRRGGGGGG